MKFAVYTTYCGETQHSQFKPFPLDLKYPHYLISNNENYLYTISKSFGFKPIFMSGHEVTSCAILSAKQAKIAKIMPHKFSELLDYDYLLYYDDKLQLDLSDIKETIETLVAFNSPMALRKHQSIPNTNVLFDFAESMYQWRYRADWETTVRYITKQIEDGYKLYSDRYSTTSVILRNMKHAETIPINEIWYEHTMKSSAVCQISFHFIRQRYKNILTLPETIVKKR